MANCKFLFLSNCVIYLILSSAKSSTIIDLTDDTESKKAQTLYDQILVVNQLSRQIKQDAQNMLTNLSKITPKDTQDLVNLATDSVNKANAFALAISQSDSETLVLNEDDSSKTTPNDNSSKSQRKRKRGNDNTNAKESTIQYQNKEERQRKPLNKKRRQINEDVVNNSDIVFKLPIKKRSLTTSSNNNDNHNTFTDERTRSQTNSGTINSTTNGQEAFQNTDVNAFNGENVKPTLPPFQSIVNSLPYAPTYPFTCPNTSLSYQEFQYQYNGNTNVRHHPSTYAYAQFFNSLLSNPVGYTPATPY